IAPFIPLKTLIMKSYKRISKNTCVRLYHIGVHKRKNGKFYAEIKHPLNKKMIWLGTLVTAEDALKNYESKKLEFEELVMAKSAKNGQISEKSDQESYVTDEFE
ncbi:ethylene-responsive transcription factor ERF119-like, partial [Capsicum annuum]|uniref:ethylene-responsive transcription factor ERF119-like n=1 Tax=Capsicum annuum TaxID=4072 RepID=UPI001FB14D85